MRYLLNALMIVFVLGLATTTQAADCSALTTGIDRDKLAFFVEDGARADAIGSDWYALEGRIGRAADWLKLAPYREADAAEAIVNARKTAEFAQKEIARLRADLKTLPKDGPSFPPVFYWPEGWLRLTFAVLDSLQIQANYLAEEAEAVAAGDMNEVARIANARNTDLSGFDSYFAAFDRQMVALLPSSHPELTLMEMRVHWHGLFALYAEREAKRDAAEVREASLKIIEKLNQVARDIDADIPKFEAAIPGFRKHLAPYLLTLSCDEARAKAGLERYIASYEAFVPLAHKTVELLRDYARVEVDFLNNGPSEEVYERYDAVSFRYEEVSKAVSAQWSERAKILTEMIRPN